MGDIIKLSDSFKQIFNMYKNLRKNTNGSTWYVVNTASTRKS